MTLPEPQVIVSPSGEPLDVDSLSIFTPVIHPAPPPSPVLSDISLEGLTPRSASSANSDVDLLAPLSDADISNFDIPSNLSPNPSPPSTPELEWTEIKIDE